MADAVQTELAFITGMAVAVTAFEAFFIFVADLVFGADGVGADTIFVDARGIVADLVFRTRFATAFAAVLFVFGDTFAVLADLVGVAFFVGTQIRRRNLL